MCTWYFSIKKSFSKFFFESLYFHGLVKKRCYSWLLTIELSIKRTMNIWFPIQMKCFRNSAAFMLKDTNQIISVSEMVLVPNSHQAKARNYANHKLDLCKHICRNFCWYLSNFSCKIPLTIFPLKRNTSYFVYFYSLPISISLVQMCCHDHII